MKIDLPLENWVDTFEYLSRKQLAALLPHIGDEQEETKNRPIADRQFVEKVQYYLHKCGDVTLGQFSIISSSIGPVFVNKAGQKLPLAEVPPMPSNIKGFKEITVNYYDQSVLGFLQQFHRNSLFTNVNLTLLGENRRKFNAMSQMMTQLLPSITSIESLKPTCHDYALFLKEHSDMLASANFLIISDFSFGYLNDDHDNKWYRHWFYIPREDGKPRVLVATHCLNIVDRIHPIHSFIEYIRKDFLDANRAVSFFAYIWNPSCRNINAWFKSLSLDNNKTQEKLVIKGTDPDLGDFVTISRYPMGAKEEWIKEMRKIIEDRCKRKKQERKIVVDLNIKSGYFTCPLF